MSAATEIFNQIKLLTADIIGLGLCDKQNFPAIR